MIPIVDNIDKQFYRKLLSKGSASFLTYKDIFPSFQITKPIEAITNVSIAIYDERDNLIQTIVDDVMLEPLSSTHHIVVHPSTEIATALGSWGLFYGKITAGTQEYYTEVFRTTNNTKIVDVRVTQSGDTRILQDNDRRIIHG